MLFVICGGCKYLRPSEENRSGWEVLWDGEWVSVPNWGALSIAVSVNSAVVVESWAVANVRLDDSESLASIGREGDLAGSSTVGSLEVGAIWDLPNHGDLLHGSSPPLSNGLLSSIVWEVCVVTSAWELRPGDWLSLVFQLSSSWVADGVYWWWVGHTHVRRGEGGQETDDGRKVLHDDCRFIVKSRFGYEGMK